MIVAALLLAACGGGPPPKPDDSVGTPLDRSLPASVARLPLVDTTGHHTDLAAYRGKVLVISDMMTLCQETCPMDTATLVATARKVEAAGLGDKVAFVSITIDPQRDDAAHLAAYRKQFAPAPANWSVLRGSPATLTALWKYFGLYYEKQGEDKSPAPKDWLTDRPLTYDISHADLVYFISADGHWRYAIDGTGHVASAGELSGTLRHFLSDKGRRNLADPGPGAWTVGQALEVVGWLAGTRIAGADSPNPPAVQVAG